MKFEFDNNIPIYIQLVDKLKNYIISGKINIGEKLPSVRELSLITKVNPNTMQKALNELESIKLIYTERTNGKYVTKDEKLIQKLRDEYVNKVTNEYLENMYSIGLNKEEIINYLEKVKEDL